MALEGTLKDFSLADIFQLIGIQKKTGILTLKNEGDVVTVSFLNGAVVSADSLKKNLEDRLGTVLVKSGKISEAKLREALRIQKETLQRLGYIFVKGGFISHEDLKDALRLQITQIVYRLFRWRDGEYHFSQEETVDYDREHFTPVGAESVLMEGIRMIDEWPIIEKRIRSFEMVFRKSRPDAAITVASQDDDGGVGQDLESALGGQGSQATARTHDGHLLAPEQAELYRLVDGHLSVQELIDRASKGEFETCRILYDLLSRGLIQEVGGAAVQAVGRRRRMAPVLEAMGYGMLAAWAAVSLMTMNRSPLSGTTREIASGSTIEAMRDLVARNRIERLDEAVQVYYLQKQFYPDDLRELVRGGLVGEECLKDPWGRGIGFLSSTGGYRLISYEEGGVENPGRSVARGDMDISASARREAPAPGPDAAAADPPPQPSQDASKDP
jgi:hypothetical protein